MTVPIRPHSVQISDDVWEALRQDPRSANQILRAELLPTAPFTQADVGQTVTGDQLVDAGVLPETFRGLGLDDAPEPGSPYAIASAERAATDTRPKNATCRHCGQRFAGPKYATVCNACQADGHINTQPADCRKCQEGFAA